MFQYISCYSLSDTTPSPVPGKCLFQYISCYSLSKYDCWIARYPAGFQYISCYSLSGRATVWKHINQCFNTSHVTLYPLSVKALKTLSKCFNTSHVTLYPVCRIRWRFLNRFNTSHVTLYRFFASDKLCK